MSTEEEDVAVEDTMTILKAKGHPFPELKAADAMFAMDTAPNWSDGRVCHRCPVEFTFTNRKHHCRNCGQVFCGQCSTKQCPLPKFGIEKDDTMTILKAKGHPFPELKEADAMFAMDTAPNWSDGRVCHRCRVEFTFTNRKHHCRNCGQLFCGQCSSKQCPLPKFGIEKDVRVCDGCFTQLQRPTSAKATGRTAAESDLPAEYLNSSLAQQVQTPPRKTEQELKEEEELQLALALSQSEAEVKKQKQQQQQQSLSAAAANYRMQQRSPSPSEPATTNIAVKELQTAEETNPDLAKYLNRSYWEQRKVSESPMDSPSAPSPMPPTPQPQMIGGQQQQQQQLPLTASDFRPKSTDEQKIDEFAGNMRMQVEIFVNRMKSNSSRGRSITNDSSVQSLFMTLTGLHSQQLSYIKELDDKRMWYEQLQDKLAQIKDSRAALDDLRHEHAEKLRQMAEEQERLRQIQMAQKLDIMRKKKQEYLQYQRQLALQRIQEQEREMQMRQEQQMAQYRMGQTAFPFLPGGMPPQGSPAHQQMTMATGGLYNTYSPNVTTAYQTTQAPITTALPGMYVQSPGGMQPQHHAHMMGQQPGGMPPQQQAGPNGQMHEQMQQQQNHMQQQQQPQLAHVMLQQQHLMHNQPPLPNIGQNMGPQSMPAAFAPPAAQQNQQPPQQHQQQPQHMPNPMPQQQPPPQQQQQQHQPQQHQPQQQQQHQPQQQQQHQPQPQQQQQHQMPMTNNTMPNNEHIAQIQAIQQAPAPPQNEPEPNIAAAPAPPTDEPATAELISFD